MVFKNATYFSWIYDLLLFNQEWKKWYNLVLLSIASIKRFVQKLSIKYYCKKMPMHILNQFVDIHFPYVYITIFICIFLEKLLVSMSRTTVSCFNIGPQILQCTSFNKLFVITNLTMYKFQNKLLLVIIAWPLV